MQMRVSSLHYARHKCHHDWPSNGMHGVRRVQHLLCMPPQPAYSSRLPPTAESRGQSLQELGLAPQAVLLMQQEDD